VTDVARRGVPEAVLSVHRVRGGGFPQREAWTSVGRCSGAGPVYLDTVLRAPAKIKATFPPSGCWRRWRLLDTPLAQCSAAVSSLRQVAFEDLAFVVDRPPKGLSHR
jgi:hypothetical protein